MNIILIYMLITGFATMIGAIAGLGGGVIIKPLFDMIGAHDAITIGVYSSFAVFSMAIVSTYKQIKNGIKINKKVVLFIGLGSLIGGYIGELSLNYVNAKFNSYFSINGIQASLLFIVLTLILIYTLNKNKFPSLRVQSPVIIFAVGAFLGIVSVFLGIGGGPLNIATITIIFSFDIKDTVVYSIITILAAQIYKLGKILLLDGFANYDTKPLIYIIISAIIGGYLGAVINNKLRDDKVQKIYILTIVSLMGISFLNAWNAFV